MKKIILGLLFIITITPSVLSVRRDCLQQAERNVLGRYDRPDKDTYAISDSGHFYSHYDTTRNAAPDLTASNGNGIPDYVDEVGMIADLAHHVLVNVMGHVEELRKWMNVAYVEVVA